mmetsp:Transcript_9395/g.17834  ORF Transcript_9395/g.17834 Transcript_9395/m.17834 type:complete len:509 (+) Transcript_9395:37-1563(+)
MPCPMPTCSTAMSPEKGQACKIRFEQGRQLYVFETMGKGGERLRVQTTVKAAGGSQAEAQRIAERCLKKCEEGWPKEKVVEFRNSLYEEAIKCVGAATDESPQPREEETTDECPQPAEEETEPSGLHSQQQQQQQRRRRRAKGKDVEGATAVAIDVDMASAAAAGAWETCNSDATGAAAEQESPAPKTPAERFQRCKKRGIIQEDVVQDLVEHREPLITEDVPSDSTAFKAVKYEEANRCCWFEFKRNQGTEKIRIQTTVPAAGGCRETAARIARLCYAEVEAGASKEQALQLRAELYKRCGPPVVKQRLEPCETFRNLFGETVSINPAAKCAAGPGLKPWQELEQSDLDRLNGDEIYHYEKELGLGSKRSLEERIARIEQMAQKTTVQHLVNSSGGSRGTLMPKSDACDAGNGLADIAAYLDSAQSDQEFEARFLQAFLTVPAEERQHTSAAEVGTLERIARIPDGAFLSVAERRARLKENLWSCRTIPSSSRESFFLKSWLKSQGA